MIIILWRGIKEYNTKASLYSNSMFQRMEHISDPWRLHKSDVYMLSFLIFVILKTRSSCLQRKKNHPCKSYSGAGNTSIQWNRNTDNIFFQSMVIRTHMKSSSVTSGQLANNCDVCVRISRVHWNLLKVFYLWRYV